MTYTQKSKTIAEPVYGTIDLTQLQDELLAQPEVQRLAWIRQLGLTNLVYVGANHTRLEHGLGVSHLAGEVADRLRLFEEEKNLLQAAGLLHDVGHTPFSHGLEPLFPKDHMEYTADIIVGKEKPFDAGGKIPEILEAHQLRPKDVADLVNRKYSGKKYLQEIIFGNIDVDQMDYLCRDSLHTGAIYGTIHVDRILRTMVVQDDDLYFLDKGLSALEDMLVARDHMYSAVYLHHAARVAELMLLRAAESVFDSIPDFYKYTDHELLQKLREQSQYAKDLIDRIIFRNLFKRAYEKMTVLVQSHEQDKINELIGQGPHAIEENLCKASDVAPGYVIADLPAHVLKVSEPRLKQAYAKILFKDGSVKTLYEVSAIAQSLATREATRTLFAAYCPKEQVGKVSAAAARLFGD